MRGINVLLLLTATFSAVNGYKVKCDTNYKVKQNDTCLSIAIKNQISKNLLTTLNPGLNCLSSLKVDSSVCVKGTVVFSNNGRCGEDYGSCPFNQCCSKNGYCGTSSDYCSTGCNSKYGMCESQNKKSQKEVNYDDAPKIFEEEAVNDIANKLSLSKSDAKKFYDNANKGFDIFSSAFLMAVNNKLPFAKCESVCKSANNSFNIFTNTKGNNFNIPIYNKYLSAHNEPTVDNDFFLNSCISNCYAINEIMLNDKNLPIKKLSNRRTDICEPVSKGKISLVKRNYKNGVSQYKQDPDSVETAIASVNGCSVPLIQNLYNSNDFGFFVPACNSHDICYGCQAGKNTCDNRFLNNMKNLCKVYNKWWQYLTQYVPCIGEAEVFYAAVHLSRTAQEHYDACNTRVTDPKCALCGPTIIQTTLIKSPFYFKN